MAAELATTNGPPKGGHLENVLVGGDLGKLTADQRTAYYLRVCDSLQLNPLTRPFEFIVLNGRLTLYARKDCTDQLRQVHGVSIDKPDIRVEDEWVIVTVAARNAAGRTDADVGVVSRKDMRGDFGNVLMKAVTKAKRRVTLSICGLGMLDETEVEAVPAAQPVPNNDALLAEADRARHLIAAARTLDALAGVWRGLDAKVQAMVVKDKDQRKAELTPPPRTREPGEDDPADDGDPTHDPRG
jgi:hypothetical protein